MYINVHMQAYIKERDIIKYIYIYIQYIYIDTRPRSVLEGYRGLPASLPVSVYYQEKG